MAITYLARRQTGVFTIRFRITTAAGRRKLLRYSLDTRDRMEARNRLVSYLAWLSPMQNAVDPGQLFDDILRRARGWILKGPARARDDLVHRTRFIDTAWTHHSDWTHSNPCPIRDFRAFELQDEVRCTLIMLNEMTNEDMRRLEIKRHEVDLGRIRSEPTESLCFDTTTGRVRAYRPEEFRDLYDPDADVEFGTRNGEMSIYDLYLEADGTRRKIQSSRGFSPAVAPTPDAVVAFDAPPLPTPSTRDVENLASKRSIASEAHTKLSAARKDFLDARRVANGDGRADEDAGLVLDFLIDFVGDKPIAEVTAENLHAFEVAMAQTPDRTRIPRLHTGSLMKRYAYAREHGYDGLKMLSEKRIRNVWHRCLHQFFQFLRDKGRGNITYKFDLVPQNAAESIKRDAWTDEEMIKLFSLPLFTGCASEKHFWTPGSCFVQNELYWAYVLIFFTGMRNSEIGTLMVSNIVCEAGTWMFDLGTKPKRTVKRSQHPMSAIVERKRKSEAGYRRMPIPRLLIDLGLLVRVEALKSSGIAVLFPEWKTFKNKKSGRDMPGHHMSKSWQYVKKRFAFVGDELTIYGGRHTRAGWYDMINLPELIKRKLLGHAPRDAHEGYGFNTLTVDEANLALKELPIEAQIAGILIIAKLQAEYDDLKIIDTW